MTKGNLAGKIFGIALVFVMIASMLGGLAGVVSNVGSRSSAALADTTEIIIDTEEGESKFTTQPDRVLPYEWWYVHDHDVFHTRGYDGNFWYTFSFPGVASYKGIWETSLPQSGNYEVFVWIPNPDAFDPNLDLSEPPNVYLPAEIATYKIFHKTGVDSVTIDQNLNKGGFTSLGVFDFGITAKVELSNNEVEYWHSVAFDAMKFVYHNRLPYEPYSPSPWDGESGVSINTDLSWSGGDPDVGDTVTYDVYFEKGDSTPDQLKSNDQTGTTYDPGTLDSTSHYYWQIVAKDNHGATTPGPVWDFTTGEGPNPPPYEPYSPSPWDGESGVSINTDLSWSGGDPDVGDTVTYDVYFEKGDSTPDQLKSNDQPGTTYDPGTLDPTSHYYWQIVAKDNHGATTPGPVWDFTTGEGPNQPPTAYIDSITPNPATQGTDTVSFTGHGTDSDGSVVAYNWRSSKDGQLSTSSSFNKPASALSLGTHTIYFKVRDNDGAWSTEATRTLTINQAPTPNQPPILSSGNVIPDSGNTSTVFNYYVNYTDSDGDAPTMKYVYVDGSPRTMTKISGDYTLGATFKYSTTLSEGDHNYSFYFDDGHGHPRQLPLSGTYPGPSVQAAKAKDLSISLSDVEMSYTGNTVTIAATVHYSDPGGEDLTNVVVEFRDEFAGISTLISTRIIPQMSPGDAATVSVETDPFSEDHAITVFVDPSDVIEEVDDTNNMVTLSGKGPVVAGVGAQYDGNSLDEVIGTFITGIEVNNIITAEVSDPDGEDDIYKVAFTLDGEVKEDTNPAAGWSVTFNMGGLTQDSTLTVLAYDKSGLVSKPYAMTVKVIDKPDWIQEAYGHIHETIATWDAAAQKYTLTATIPEPPIDYEYDFNIPFWGLLENYFKAGLTVGADYWIDVDRRPPEFVAWGELNAKILNHEVAGGSLTIEGALYDDLTFKPINIPILQLHLFEASVPIIQDTVLAGASIGPVYVDVVISIDFGLSADVEMEAAVNVDLTIESVTITSEIVPSVTFDAAARIYLGVAKLGVRTTPTFDVQIPVTYSFSQDPNLQCEPRVDIYIDYTIYGSILWGCFGGDLYSGRYDVYSDRPGSSYAGAKMLVSQSPDNETFLFNDPCVDEDGQGNAIIVWIRSDGNISGVSNPEVYYCVWNGTGWSEPTAITENERYETTPVVVYDSEGNPIAIWTQNKLSKGDAEVIGDDISQILSNQELYYSKWNGTAWNEPQPITDNDKPDGLASIAALPNGDAVVTWVYDADGDLNTNVDWEIRYSTWDGFCWTEPANITNNDAADLSVDVASNSTGDAIAVWVHDEDGNFTATFGDNEVYYSLWNGAEWSTPGSVASNDEKARMPSVAFTPEGNAVTTWVGGSNIYHKLYFSLWDNDSSLWSEPEIVTEGDQFITYPIVNVGPNNNAIIVWRGYGGYDGELIYSLKNLTQPDATWTEPKLLTDDELIDWMATVAIDSANNILIVDSKTSFSDSSQMEMVSATNGGVPDGLCFISHPIQPDLSLTDGDISFSHPAPAEGNEVVIEATIHNVGDLESNSTVVRFFDGDPAGNGTQVGTDQALCSLMPDGEGIVSVNWTATPGKHDIYVKADPENAVEEINETNNVAFNTIGVLPDLSLESEDINFSNPYPLNGETITINATIHNIGGSDATDIAVRFFDGDPAENGTQIGLAQTVASIPLGEVGTASVEWATTPGKHDIYVVIDPDDIIEETNETNNVAFKTIEILPDLSLTAEDIAFSNPNPLDGEAIMIDVTVYNTGGVDASNITVQLFDGHPLLNGTLIAERTIGSIPSGATGNASATWNVTVGTHDVYVKVDPDDGIEEWGENNNMAFKSLISNLEELSASFRDIYSDYGVDTNGDGLYEYLTIDVGMNVTTGGNYTTSGWLSGSDIAWASATTYLNVGNQSVSLNFDGMTIYEHGIDGPYNLSYLAVYDENGTLVDYQGDAYTTSPYNYTDFGEHLPIICISPCSLSLTAAPDTTVNTTYTITNCGGGTLNWDSSNVTYDPNGNMSWLGQNITSGTLTANASDTVLVTVNAAGLAEGTYNATITITGSTFILPVILDVTEPGTDIDVMRDLPADALDFDATYPGDTFEVYVNFTAPADNFTDISLRDLAPDGWNVIVDEAWCTPNADDVLATGNRAAMVWLGPYANGTSFSAKYRVTVPETAAPGINLFPNCDFSKAWVMYYFGATGGPYMSCIRGEYVMVITVPGDVIGETRDVNANEVSNVTVMLYKDASEVGSYVSTPNYNNAAYTTGEYWLRASKDQYFTLDTNIMPTPRNPYHADYINFTTPELLAAGYTLDFEGDYGLVPKACCMSYALESVNHWLFVPLDGGGTPPPEWQLSGWKAMESVHSWQYPNSPRQPEEANDQVIRILPQQVNAGDTFNVTVTFTASGEDFNSISLTDLAPDRWDVTVDEGWCTPNADAVLATGNKAEIVWLDPYANGTSFTALYQATVPANATLGNYSFPVNAGNAWLGYYLAEQGPYYQSIGGDHEVVVNGAPVANFVVNNTNPCVNTPVNFTDLSTGEINNWTWDFGDGGNSTFQNPTHQYTPAGTYTVSLTVGNECGNDTKTKPNYIMVRPAPQADFSAEPTSGYAPLTVNFTDLSTGNPDSWSWDFPGGSPANASGKGSHTVTYSAAGTYTASLNVTNECGSDTATASITAVPPPVFNCSCGDICVNTTGWWRDGSAFNVSAIPIQDAVNNATNGDTICVRDGTYHENVDVNIANLTIQSENGYAMCIVEALNPDNDVFYVTANWVNITGFTVKDATGANEAGIYLNATSHCNISSNNALNNDYGIYLEESSNNTLTNNSASNNTYGGIYLASSSNNALTNNTAWNNTEGGGIYLASSSNNTLANNTASDNPYAAFILISSSNNNLTDNKAWNSTYGGIYLESSSNNTLTNNLACNNTYGGIISGQYSSNNTLSNNLAWNNTYGGIWLDHSSNNTLINNRASNNTYGGIGLYKSSDNALTNDTAWNNTYGGIILEDCSNSTLRNNTVLGSQYQFGVYGDYLSHFIHNIDTSNKIDGKPIYYWVGEKDKQIPSDAGYVGIANCTNITVKNLDMSSNAQGVLLAYSSHSRIENITASGNLDGIYVQNSSNSTLANNSALNNAALSNDFFYIDSYGIYLGDSSNNTLNNNTVTNNTNRGIHLYSSSGNTIYNNYFDNTNNAWDNGNNTWNITSSTGPNILGGPYLGGNYWADYTGVDTNGDGLGDTPYNIAGDSNKDYLPLMVTVPGVTVTVDAPAGAKTGDYFTATVDISSVTDFDAADFRVVFNSTVLAIDDITPGADITNGLIAGTTIPLAETTQISAGIVKVVINVPGTPGVTGSGYLCQIRFHAIGVAGTSSTINLENGGMSDKAGSPIVAVWTGDSINVLAHALGDANGDDALNALDITEVELIVAEAPGHPQTPEADANQDGLYNAQDITLIEIIVGQA